MDYNQFDNLMHQAQSLKSVDDKHSDYYIGYVRGLRRLYHGSDFGTAEAHEVWYNIPADDLDIIRRMRGCGYRDAYGGGTPRQWMY